MALEAERENDGRLWLKLWHRERCDHCILTNQDMSRTGLWTGFWDATRIPASLEYLPALGSYQKLLGNPAVKSGTIAQTKDGATWVVYQPTEMGGWSTTWFADLKMETFCFPTGSAGLESKTLVRFQVQQNQRCVGAPASWLARSPWEGQNSGKFTPQHCEYLHRPLG